MCCQGYQREQNRRSAWELWRGWEVRRTWSQEVCPQQTTSDHAIHQQVLLWSKLNRMLRFLHLIRNLTFENGVCLFNWLNRRKGHKICFLKGDMRQLCTTGCLVFGSWFWPLNNNKVYICTLNLIFLVLPFCFWSMSVLGSRLSCSNAYKAFVICMCCTQITREKLWHTKKLVSHWENELITWSGWIKKYS